MHPGAGYLLTIAVISGATLAYEVLLLRLFSLIQWHHFAFMVISLALLGYGVSGVFLALARQGVSRHFPRVILANILLLGMAMPVCFLLAQAIPFNPAQLLWDPWQLVYWLGVYLILALPFFFAANIIGLSLYQFRTGIPTLYAADLLGAALGSVAIIALLFVIDVELVLWVLPLLVLLAGLLLLSRSPLWVGTERRIWQAGLLVVATGTVLTLPGAMQLNLSSYKGLSQLLTVPETRVLQRKSSPLGVLSVVESRQVPLRFAPGLSILSDSQLPEQLAVFSDADAMTAITRFDGDIEALSFLGQTSSALPYQFRAMDDVLVLGAGTGSDVLQALLFQSPHIDAVEANPQMIELVQDDYAAYAGNLYNLPQVEVHQSEARAYITNTERQYDLITMSFLSGAGTTGGLYSMSENYLFTVESICDTLSHLRPGGYLSITQPATLPPRVVPKLIATVSAALDTETLTPSQSLMLIRSWQTTTLVIKNGRINAEEIGQLKAFSQQFNFDIAYYPGMTEPVANRFHQLKAPYFYQAATALLTGDRDGFVDDYKFNIAPATDNQPYFSQFFKWETLPEILSLLDAGSIFLLESGYLLLLAALVQAMLASFVLLLLPLWLWRRRRRDREQAQPLHKRVLAYFFALGLAFLFVEIAFIQKFVLILHHPVYAVTTVIAGFLLAAGLGSYLSGRLSQVQPRSQVIAAVMVMIVLSAVYLTHYAAIAQFLLAQSDILRYLLAILMILPLGFCMGVPFPAAMSMLGREHDEMIPWAWGINGFASVMSPILATLIAIQFGFRVLIAVALLLYLLTVWLFPSNPTEDHAVPLSD
ncbi:SAM-dependent methyltransferase [Methylophaga sp. OBS1]|uniref:SAM-dependent methyltransferase n=1 Tax=Methylophaga sp. OBS1 TaxID=2991933 RepID=UPI00224E9DD4|nr:SAM-dependent methyltransferase [Methylophaga sp. OBS1]MCX4192842.1 SAM-dependent methyltransferase [Methylophaga sp. OBS1]